MFSSSRAGGAALIALISISALFVIGIIVALWIFMASIGYNNREIALRTAIEAKQLDNKNVYDNLWKKIQEIAKIPDRERDSAIKMFVSYADARTPDNGGSMMQWIQEQVPQPLSQDLYKELMHTIVASRSHWEANQKSLIDLNRERNSFIESVPASWFVKNTTRIEIVVVTSTRTERAFETGKDDQVLVQ